MIKVKELLRICLLGLPPSANSMYRTGRYGTRYKRSEVRDWQEDTAGRIRSSWADAPYVGKVEVHVVFTVKGKRRWDIDNRLKLLLDCLELGGVIEDDSQIWGIRAYKEAGQTDSVDMEICEYSGTAKK